MRNAESNGPADALREFCETLAKQAEKIAAAVFESAEKLAETLAPLVEEAEKALSALLPMVLEEIRCGCAYKPTKKDAPRKTGRPHAAARPRAILYRARCGI
jgi:hypothetical protein